MFDRGAGSSGRRGRREERGRRYYLNSLLPTLRLVFFFNFFNAGSISKINIKKALSRFDRGVGSSGGRGRDGEAMLLPELPTTDFAPCFPHRKDLHLSIFPCGSQYGSGILTRTFESPCLSQSITEAIA